MIFYIYDPNTILYIWKPMGTYLQYIYIYVYIIIFALCIYIWDVKQTYMM